MVDTMSDTNALSVIHETGEIVEFNPTSLGPIMPIAEMAKMIVQLQQFIDTQLVADTDYGLIPGMKQKSLYKPGAEKFTFWFGLAIEYVHVAGEVTAQRVSHVEGCRLTSMATRQVKAYVERSCSSDEENMQKAYLSLQAKGYTDVRAIDNTVRGMAQKRALVAATLLATMASGFLTAHEGGEDERKELGVNGNADRPDWCTIHKSRMYKHEGKDGGAAWYSHKLPDGTWCNGPKKTAAPAAAAPATPTAPAQPASIPALPTGRGDMLNWIETQRAAHKMTPQALTAILKADPFFHGSLSGCTDEELIKLADMLTAKWATPAPEQPAEDTGVPDSAMEAAA